MHHGPEFTIVLIVIAALFLGALMRGVSQRSGFPYTILILLLGLVGGVFLRQHHDEGSVGHMLEQGAHISPHLIIFAFLPALVFESAFALEAYSFFRNIGAIVMLAVPALLVATVATAFSMVTLTAGSWNWGWPAALVFGALISATDPVAVVAILRELGAPKRLGVLIEGESLMNDGTSIVVFNVLIGMLTVGADLDVGAAMGSFFKVVFGGIAVGLALGWATTAWLKRTFNDPLTEITLTLLLAYSSMIIAEGFLHVSGVMALVAAGLYMGSQGRTRISPEVEHFLHGFWETLAYIANTLIFLLVGLVIGTEIRTATLLDAGLIFGAYAAIMAIRFAIGFGFLPLMNAVGDRITSQQVMVMSWGGLRGAVSLALALIISQNPSIDGELRHQIVMTAAGVVLLTIVINGSTIGALLKRYGFDSPPLGVQLAVATAQAGVVAGVRRQVEELKTGRELRTVHWGDVDQDLDTRAVDVGARLSEIQECLANAHEEVRAEGYWEQALSVERQAYWAAFGKGALGERATRMLNREIDVQMDALSRDDLYTPPPLRAPSNTGALARLASIFKGSSIHFDQLALSYDLARGENLAALEVLRYLDHVKTDEPELIAPIKAAYAGYRNASKERLEDLRTNLPEITAAIETRLARRVALNLEREGYDHLAHEGVLEHGTAQAMMNDVEAQMKRLLLGRTELELPETADLCRDTPMFSSLSEDALGELADLTDERVYRPGEALFAEGDDGDSMFVIARGAARVIKEIDGEEVVLDVLGGGDILGEMALLTKAPRTASVVAATTLTVGEIGASAFDAFLAKHPQLARRIWTGHAARVLDNHLRDEPGFEFLDAAGRKAWVGDHEVRRFDAGDVVPCAEARYAFAITGTLEVDGVARRAPALVEVSGEQVVAGSEARVLMLPDPGAALARHTLGGEPGRVED